MNNETNRRSVVSALIIATFLTAIEGTIVSTAMPKIVEDLGGSHLYTWVISVYLLTTVISTPIFGKLADLYGRKIMFILGVLIFLAGSTLSGLSQSMEQLVIFRAIQGIGAGALTTIPFTIIGDIFTYEQRGKIQGLISSVWGVSGIIGPLAGGFIVDQISWHWIFFMNIPFGIVSIFLIWMSLHEQIEKKKHVIDYAGIFTFAISTTAFLFALSLLKEQKQMTGTILTLFVVTIIGVLLFLWIEAKGREPMLPLSLFAVPMITIANIAGFLLGFILITANFYIPLWVQGVTNLNATLSGVTMLPMSVAWLCGAILSGRWLSKTAIGKVTLTGTLVITAGCLGMVFFQTDTTIPWMMVVTAIMGFGYGITFTAFSVAVQSAVDWKMRGAAMGSHNLMKNLGQAIGIAVSGLWLSDQLKGIELETSLHTIFIKLVVLSLFALGASGMLLRKKAKQFSPK
ncbi:MDR family MFS transporter [Bacillus dakarensis]|uniref:MDR family MFS transporter n=1 Tax=Robertmurraya dakarensis TaxID=1926278 RepID=UPI000980F782|nr:MDR family MFS transporter [Bacillus dakarensis]